MGDRSLFPMSHGLSCLQQMLYRSIVMLAGREENEDDEEDDERGVTVFHIHRTTSTT